MSAHRPIDRPKVSVALPVFNGESFLAQAIESVLAQSFTDLELVICDNASTDATQAIGEAFVCRDPRVRYHRNPSNLGAAPNYNKAFALSRGRYFKWLAHDDLIEPDYLQQTVAALDARPELVLCNTAVDVIDEAGRVIGSYSSVLGRADLPNPADRFALFVIEPHTGVDIFGLMRRSALEGSVLHPSFHGADRALLAQLALRGPMLQLPARLHQIREHANRYTRQASSARFRALWHDATRRPSRQVPILQLYATYRHIVRDADLSPDERRRCNLALARWWLANWNSLRVAVDLLATAVPGIVGMAEGLKVKLAGRSVGHFEPPARAEPTLGSGAAGATNDRPVADRPVDQAAQPH
jgi:glycosyltransferase involved in cell wall biosynthesis